MNMAENIMKLLKTEKTVFHVKIVVDEAYRYLEDAKSVVNQI